MPLKKTVLMVQSDIAVSGGQIAVFAWTLQALYELYDVTIFTWGASIDVATLNRQYGTSIADNRFRIRRPSFAMRALRRCIVAFDRDVASIQPMMLLLRLAKKFAGTYDLAMACEMESDLGVRGIQYIHFPWLGRFAPMLAAGEALGFWRKVYALTRGESRPWMLLADYSLHRMTANRTLTNSAWTGLQIKKFYNIDAAVLYPPGAGDFKPVPWEQRRNGILCIGRIHPEKRLDWLIDALEPLVADIPDLHLHIVGKVGHRAEERSFFEAIQRKVAEHFRWVTLHTDLSRDELAELAVKQRYGVHAMLDEHFGMAIAEMVRAGCIPFVHDSGGAVEIVKNDPRLLYQSAEELRDRMLHVVRDESAQQDLCASLKAGAERFSPDHFVQGTREVVAAHLRDLSQVDIQ